MANWRIHSPRNLDWQCRLGDCDEAHANSVMDTLRQDPACPDYLELENLTPDLDPEPESELEVEVISGFQPDQITLGEEPLTVMEIPDEPKRRFWRLRRG